MLCVAGEAEGIEKPVDPIRMHSEKELTKEMEKVACLLTAEQDWSVRLAAMQKLEGLIVGGRCIPISHIEVFRHERFDVLALRRQ